MSIQEAQANLVNNSSITLFYGYLPVNIGFFDQESVSIKALAQNNWVNSSTWEGFSWQGTADKIIWTSDIQDIGSIKHFTLDIRSQAQGQVLSYTVFVSETGGFNGEEKVYYIPEGSQDVPSFYGRYYSVQIAVEGTELFSFEITSSTLTKTFELTNIDTATLSGTVDQRELTLDFPVSGILDVIISAKSPAAYNLDLYVSSTQTSRVLLPVVLEKSQASTAFTLLGLDNKPRNGIVDVKITALPRQVMFAGNLQVLN
jgi:hypothetical protein